MHHTFRLQVLSQASIHSSDLRLVQLEAERALKLGDIVRSAKRPQGMPRAGQLASKPGGAKASIQPPLPSYPDVKYIITMLVNHSPMGRAGRNVGGESTFCTDWVFTQCMLEERRGGLNAPVQGWLGNCRFS